MRRGCISLGDVRCDGCQRLIPHSERYLVIEENAVTVRLCVNCCLEKGYAHHKESKHEEILTFFSE